MEGLIAYCGLVCDRCPAYQATQADDTEALARVAAEWTEMFNAPITVADVICDGCASGSDRLASYCGMCDVRACAVERTVVTCAHCDDYGCERITAFFDMAPEARESLEGIRAGL